MKNIKIDKMAISHFKGIRSLDIRFGDITNVYGDNATGKTTIMDAFLWTLFGKDSTDRKEFEIKHISQNGYGPKDAEVEVLMWVDEQPISLKRSFREKWQKKRGNAEAEFVGHETLYTCNDVPVTMKEYQEKIADICTESVFKLITNPAYFPGLKWQDQRTVLFEIAGSNIDDTDIAEQHPDFKELLLTIDRGKTLDEFRRQIGAQKKRIREELESIPARIDEVNRSIPADENWDELKAEVKKLDKELTSLDTEITDKSKAYQRQYEDRAKIQQELYTAKEQLSTIIQSHEEKGREREAEVNKNYHEKQMELETLIARQKRGEAKLQEILESIEDNKKSTDNLREKWYKVNARVFNVDPGACICPTCKRPLDDYEAQEEEMRQRFNSEKATELNIINQTGKSLKAQSETLTDELTKIQDPLGSISLAVIALREKLQDMEPARFEVDHETIPGYKDAKTLIDRLERQYNMPMQQPDIDDKKRQKAMLQAKIQDVNTVLSLQDQIVKSNARIKELEKQQKVMAQELANLEKQEFVIASFEKARTEAIEEQINGMFEMVRWQLFETQINGQDIPTCKATFKKVPYSDLNSAAKTNVGIDIINTICQHYGITAPIFIDNREGVNNLIKTPSQLINLIVSKDPELIVTT